jgi:hypothetical protein
VRIQPFHIDRLRGNEVVRELKRYGDPWRLAERTTPWRLAMGVGEFVTYRPRQGSLRVGVGAALKFVSALATDQ